MGQRNVTSYRTEVASYQCNLQVQIKCVFWNSTCVLTTTIRKEVSL